MLNYLWGGVILIGIVYAAFHGTLGSMTEAALDSAGEAVSLCITMLGIMSFWVGMMRVAEKAGIIRAAQRGIRPVVKYLFPNIPADHRANQYITENMIANIFGLGWAATPAGLKAMEELAELEGQRQCSNVYKGKGKCGKLSVASDEMCTFLIINISSLQLIPVNIIAYRSQYGSVNPTAIVGPGIMATICSTMAAVVFCKIMMRKNGN